MTRQEQIYLAINDLANLANEMLEHPRDFDALSSVDYMLNALRDIIDKKDMKLLNATLKKLTVT